MHLGDILVGRGLVGAADIEAALARQSVEGGRLGDNLIAMGLLSAEQLTGVFNTAPAVPAGPPPGPGPTRPVAWANTHCDPASARVRSAIRSK